MKTIDKENLAVEFGAYVRAAREKQGLYQYEVADMLGVSRSYYTYIEAGTREIYFSLAVNICRVLNLDMSDFMKSLK